MRTVGFRKMAVLGTKAGNGKLLLRADVAVAALAGEILHWHRR